MYFGPAISSSSRVGPIKLCRISASMSEGAPSRENQLQKFFEGKPKIILGSESSSRRGAAELSYDTSSDAPAVVMDELASKWAFSYFTAKAAIDESKIGNRRKQPGELVTLLAKAKADAILEQTPLEEGYLITCDQVVVYNGGILEKPRDVDEARKFIRGYGSRPASTVGSILCTNLATKEAHNGIDVTQVCFKTIPEDTVETLVKQGDVFQCAGGLMIEHPLVAPLITSIMGTEDSIKGLCKETVLTLLLRAAGLPFQEEESDLFDSEDEF